MAEPTKLVATVCGPHDAAPKEALMAAAERVGQPMRRTTAGAIQSWLKDAGWDICRVDEAPTAVRCVPGGSGDGSGPAPLNRVVNDSLTTGPASEQDGAAGIETDTERQFVERLISWADAFRSGRAVTAESLADLLVESLLQPRWIALESRADTEREAGDLADIPRLHVHEDGAYLSIGFVLSNDTLLQMPPRPNAWRDHERAVKWAAAVNRYLPQVDDSEDER